MNESDFLDLISQTDERYITKHNKRGRKYDYYFFVKGYNPKPIKYKIKNNETGAESELTATEVKCYSECEIKTILKNGNLIR